MSTSNSARTSARDKSRASSARRSITSGRVLLFLGFLLIVTLLAACDSIPTPGQPTAVPPNQPTPTTVSQVLPTTDANATPVAQATLPPDEAPTSDLPTDVLPTPVSPTPLSVPSPTQDPNFSTPDPLSLTPWVPPTALVGTPIPGAEATLTVAPHLNAGTLTILNSLGEKVVLHVEVAGDEPSRELGLMFRDQLSPDAGMLFDFGVDTTSGFWMQNTLLPLSIAFMKADGTIINIADMKPLDTTIVPAAGAYTYALEVNQGYFKQHTIVVGGKALLPVVPDK